MSSDFLGERRKGLEDAFFSKKDRELLEQMKANLDAQTKRQQLTEATGISNPAVLDELLSLGLTAETMLALSLIPLVEVAWADGSIAAAERTALLEACAELGIASGSIGYQLVEKWLATAPGPELLNGWKTYVAALCEKMDSAAKESFKDDILGRARRVAESAGGILGMGQKVSASEKAMLDQLAGVFK